jgi:pyridoxamine 5'-phosphate oxidase
VPDSPSGLPDDPPALRAADLGGDPFAAFRTWLTLARESGEEAADAMALATTSAAGVPSVRMVLLRGPDDRGLTFHTHRLSRKGGEIAAVPRAAIVLHWTRPFHRQVRVEGRVEALEDEASDAYFHSRPVGGRLSAWASPQSQVVASRAELERLWEVARHRFPDDEAIPRPPNWGGYRLVPDVFEFWQSRRDRLHDRIRFRRLGDSWMRERLAP